MNDSYKFFTLEPIAIPKIPGQQTRQETAHMEF